MADDLSSLSTCCDTDYAHQHENEIKHISHNNILQFKAQFPEFS
jgi:hypothetical protein